jgi:membrane protein DedA with SNARE-associated domain
MSAPDSLSHFNAYLDFLFSHGPIWAYVILFATCFIENVFPPFPGDSFVVAGGGLVALGRLDLTMTMVVIVAGGMASVMLIYYTGRNYGRDYFIRKNFRYFGADDIRRMEKKLARWGAVILILSRFVVGLRTVIALAAGIGRYPTVGMAIYTTISYILFTGLIVYLSMNLVEHFDAIAYYFGAYNKVVWPMLIVLAIGYVVRRYLAGRKRA